MHWRTEWLKRATPEAIAEHRAKEKVRVRAWEVANQDKVKARNRKRDPEKARVRRARWRAKNPDYVSENDLTKRAAKREATKQKRAVLKVAAYKRKLERNKLRAAANKEWVTAYKAKWYAANRERLIQRAREWHAAHPGHIRQRRANEPQFAIAGRLRTRMQKALKAQGAVRAVSTLALIGCTGEQFRAYIETQFPPEMGWHNRSEWHLDHKLPCVYFDLTDPAQQAACFHFSNIQPLWKKANRTKGAKVLPEFLQAEGN